MRIIPPVPLVRTYHLHRRDDPHGYVLLMHKVFFNFNFWIQFFDLDQVFSSKNIKEINFKIYGWIDILNFHMHSNWLIDLIKNGLHACNTKFWKPLLFSKLKEMFIVSAVMSIAQLKSISYLEKVEETLNFHQNQMIDSFDKVIIFPKPNHINITSQVENELTKRAHISV